MTDRPILFSAPMVRALLDGRKTQTRRALGQLDVFTDSDGREAEVSCLQIEGESLPRVTIGRVVTLTKLKAAVGDRLWVRESYLPDPPSDDPAWHNNVCSFVEWSGCGSRVSDVPPPLRISSHCIFAADDMWRGMEMVWRPSIHMPRWASRLTLVVTNVRVERLQDISRGDAMEEGCPFPNMADGQNPRDWFMGLWDQINGPGAWDANPWVGVYGFSVIAKNIDQVKP